MLRLLPEIQLDGVEVAPVFSDVSELIHLCFHIIDVLVKRISLTELLFKSQNLNICLIVKAIFQILFLKT